MKAMNKQPWFIDTLDRVVEEFYDQFENELSETMFVFMTEQMGRQKRTLCEAAEAINCSIHGRDLMKLMDDEYEDLPYDEFFMENSELCQQVMTRLIRRFADGY